jgi:hypothetical protein
MACAGMLVFIVIYPVRPNLYLVSSHRNGTHVNVDINLGGLTDRMQRILKTATNFVAIGLNAIGQLSVESMKISDTPIQNQFDANNPWFLEEAREAWRLWILGNGFRDVAGAVSGTFEEIQTILSRPGRAFRLKT